MKLHKLEIGFMTLLKCYECSISTKQKILFLLFVESLHKTVCLDIRVRIWYIILIMYALELERGTITNPQLSKIYTSARQAGIDKDLLHTMCFEMFRKEHLRELSKSQAVQIINKMEGKNTSRKYKTATQKAYKYFRKSVVVANTQKPTPKYDLPYTPAQKWKIIHTMEEINLNAGYKLNDLAQRIIDQDVLPDWKLTSAQASKLIAGLTKINQQLKS